MTDTQVNMASFRQAMGLFSTGITIVRAESSDMYTGLTANSFTSVSLDPALILVCLDNKAQTLDIINQAKNFTVDILSAAQTNLAWMFSKSDRSLRTTYLRDHPSGRALPDSLAMCKCTLEHNYAGGDHRIIVGRVTELYYNDTDEEIATPAIYFNSKILSV